VPCLCERHKIRIDESYACKYPDVSAVCGDRSFFDARRDVLLNPSLIIEVLSDSTEAYDRGEKFALYRRVPSLKEYFLVSQHQWCVEIYSRQHDGRWLLAEYSNADDVVSLDSVDCTLSLREIYDKVEFFEDNVTKHDLTM